MMGTGLILDSEELKRFVQTYICIEWLRHPSVEINGPHQAKQCFRPCANVQIQIMSKESPGLCFQFIHSIVSSDFVSVQERP